MVTAINILTATTSFSAPQPQGVPNHKFQTKHGEMLFSPFLFLKSLSLGLTLRYLMKMLHSLPRRSLKLSSWKLNDKLASLWDMKLVDRRSPLVRKE